MFALIGKESMRVERLSPSASTDYLSMPIDKELYGNLLIAPHTWEKYFAVKDEFGVYKLELVYATTEAKMLQVKPADAADLEIHLSPNFVWVRRKLPLTMRIISFGDSLKTKINFDLELTEAPIGHSGGIDKVNLFVATPYIGMSYGYIIHQENPQ